MAAAKHLTPVTLEVSGCIVLFTQPLLIFPSARRYVFLSIAAILSNNYRLLGKCPVVIDPSCDLKTAARRIMWAKTANAGQVRSHRLGLLSKHLLFLPRHALLLITLLFQKKE